MYTNRFTKANPCLLIYLVDQSYSMTDPWADDKSLAEHTALAVNRCIGETIMRFTDYSVGVKESANVVIIGYGGIENSDTAYIIAKGTIKEFAYNPLRFETVNRKVLDEDISFEMPIWIEPKGVWCTPMANAFELAYQIICVWSNFKIRPDARFGLHENDPVPIVINITGSMPTDSIDDVKAKANKIKSIAYPDGNPLIFNVHLKPQGG